MCTYLRILSSEFLRRPHNLALLGNVKYICSFFQNFVAISEYMNFIKPSLQKRDVFLVQTHLLVVCFLDKIQTWQNTGRESTKMSGGAQTLDASRRISNFFSSKRQIYNKRRSNLRVCIVFTRFYPQNKEKKYIFSLKMKFDRRQRTNPTKIEFVLFDSAHLFAIGIIKTSLTQPLVCVKSKQTCLCFCQN